MCVFDNSYTLALRIRIAYKIAYIANLVAKPGPKTSFCPRGKTGVQNWACPQGKTGFASWAKMVLRPGQFGFAPRQLGSATVCAWGETSFAPGQNRFRLVRKIGSAKEQNQFCPGAKPVFALGQNRASPPALSNNRIKSTHPYGNQ